MITKVRVLLICTLLLLAALPSFAAPPCQACDYWSNECVRDPNTGVRCRYTATGCEEYGGYCISYSHTTVLAEWKVASVEITRPTLEPQTAPAPIQVAEVRTVPPPTE